MLYSFKRFGHASFHTTKEDAREVILHMGDISEVIISSSKQYNDNGKNDFQALSW